jgi:hypothetical protein
VQNAKRLTTALQLRRAITIQAEGKKLREKKMQSRRQLQGFVGPRIE